jgi:hypothetical protein
VFGSRDYVGTSAAGVRRVRPSFRRACQR